MKEIFEETIGAVYTDKEMQFIVFISAAMNKHWAYGFNDTCYSFSYFKLSHDFTKIINKEITGMKKTIHEEFCIGPDKYLSRYGYYLSTIDDGRYLDGCFVSLCNEREQEGICCLPYIELIYNSKLIYPLINEATEVDEYPGNIHYVLENKLPLTMTIGDSKEGIKLYPYKVTHI